MAFLLNGQQQDSLIQLDKFINSKTDKLFLLEGFAGTGKTTVITHLFGSRKFKKDIAFAATTNKAVSVIQSMFKHKYEHVDFKT
jgi:predicted P-loop ATPase